MAMVLRKGNGGDMQSTIGKAWVAFGATGNIILGWLATCKNGKRPSSISETSG